MPPGACGCLPCRPGSAQPRAEQLVRAIQGPGGVAEVLTVLRSSPGGHTAACLEEASTPRGEEQLAARPEEQSKESLECHGQSSWFTRGRPFPARGSLLSCARWRDLSGFARNKRAKGLLHQAAPQASPQDIRGAADAGAAGSTPLKGRT